MAPKKVSVRLADDVVDYLEHSVKADSTTEAISQCIRKLREIEKRGIMAVGEVLHDPKKAEKKEEDTPKPVVSVTREDSMDSSKLAKLGVVVMEDEIAENHKRHRLYKYDKFRYPVCGNNNSTHGWVIKPWWCPLYKIPEVYNYAKKYTENGFSFHVGSEEMTDDDISTQVIMNKEQQRGRNLRFYPSRDLVPALIGDRWVWLEIEDVEKAYNFLQSNSDIPCAVVYDLIRYGDDELYRKTVDLCVDYISYYYESTTPKKLHVSYDDFISESL